MYISRRMAIAAAVLLPLRPAFASEIKPKLRPPGALPEGDFLARCNRCQRCIQVCETRCVFPASFVHGITAVNTPVVSFKDSYCNSCLKCSLTCPTGALEPVTKGTLHIGIALIVEKDCVAWDWIGCTICVDKCPLKAIYLDEQKRPVVLPEKCNGCGICQHECPSTSLRTSITGKGVIVVPRGPDVPAMEEHDGQAV